MADRTLAGVAFMLGFAATGPLIDAFSKLAADTLPVGQVTAARFVVQGALMLPVAALGGGLLLPRALWGPVALRGVLLAASTFAFVSAVDVMPLADAMAVFFVMPFILMLLARLVHGDPVGPRRVAAAFVGFAGALLVIRPSVAAFGWAALWPLATAVAFAGYMLVTRGLSGRLAAVPMQLHTAAAAAAPCLLALWAAEGTGAAAWDPLWPEGRAWAWLLGTGVASAVAHLLVTAALARAPAATLAPLNYLEIVGAAALGALVFGDVPEPATGAGIALIVGSGLYVIHRERAASAARRAAPPRRGRAPGAAG